MVAAEKLGAAKLEGVTTTGHAEVVADFGAAENGQIGQEDVSTQIVRKPEDLQADFSRLGSERSTSHTTSFIGMRRALPDFERGTVRTRSESGSG